MIQPRFFIDIYLFFFEIFIYSFESQFGTDHSHWQASPGNCGGAYIEKIVELFVFVRRAESADLHQVVR